MSNPQDDRQEKKIQISEEEIDEAVETVIKEAEEEGAVTLNMGC